MPATLAPARRSTGPALAAALHSSVGRVALLAGVLALTACQQDALTAPGGRPSTVIGSPIPPGDPIPSTTSPTIDSVVVPTAPIAIGTGMVSVPVTATFTDAGGGTYTSSIDCGGGDVSNQVTTTNTAAGTCSYAAPGVYTVTVTVANGNGTPTSKSAPTYVVVYDAGAGFVTGGGWIIAPAGSSTKYPSLSGRANFGFVAKYEKGATVPTGQTEFQFQLGGINFHSTSYQWLVVSGGRAQYKGQGTINGSGNYGFLITAIDGHVAGTKSDGFRIKLTDANGAVVFDNQAGQGEITSAATDLAGGAITIHK